MSNARPPTASSELDDVPALPPSSALAAAAAGEHFHPHNHPPILTQSQPEDASGSQTKRPKRRSSSASRVAVDYFDPEGVHELKRSHTIQSQKDRSMEPLPGLHSSGRNTPASESGSLDLEKLDLSQFMKDIVQRCVAFALLKRSVR